MKIVFMISQASMLNSSQVSTAEIQNLTLLLSGCSILSPPTTARSIRSRLHCNPRAWTKSCLMTVMAALLSKRTFLSQTRPLAALKRTLTIGRMPLPSKAIPLAVEGSMWSRYDGGDYDRCADIFSLSDILLSYAPCRGMKSKTLLLLDSRTARWPMNQPGWAIRVLLEDLHKYGILAVWFF